MENQYSKIHNLSVSNKILNFVNEELLKDTNISSEKFWKGFDRVVHELAPINKNLLKIREDLQKKIYAWLIEIQGNEINLVKYKKFLEEIGYLKKIGPDFKIKTNNEDQDFFSAIKICKKKRIGPNREEANRRLFYKKDLGVLARSGFDFEVSRRVMEIDKEEYLKIINLL